MESKDRMGPGYVARVVVVNGLAAIALVSAIAVTHAKMTSPEPAPPPVPAETAKPSLAPGMAVSVIRAHPDQYRAQVMGYGEATARYALSYSAEVSGRVTHLSDRFVTGRLVKKGEVLARVDQTNYRQAVAAAKSSMAQASLNLLEAQREREQARLEWERSGLEGKPGSLLVLHEPQVSQAEAALASARETLAKAQRDLNNTEIRAPFDALVVSRDIQLGSVITTGGSVATLFSTDAVEVAVPLTDAQWSRLPHISNDALAAHPHDWPVTLVHAVSGQSWTGYVERVEQHLDTESRQRTLVVQVPQPFSQEVALYPGTFVTATIPGIEVNQLLELPASAMSQSGQLWFVNADNRLANIPAEVQFEKAGQIYVKAPEGLNELRIVKRPLSSYIAGAQVRVLEDR